MGCATSKDKIAPQQIPISISPSTEIHTENGHDIRSAEKTQSTSSEKQNLDHHKDETGLMYRDIKYDAQNILTAAKRGNIEVIRIAIQNKADINVIGMWGCTPLILSLQYNHDIITVLLLEQIEININHINEKGGSALLYACMNNNIIIIRKLLELKAHIHPPPSKLIQIPYLEISMICTPFSLVCILGTADIFKLFISYGCDMNIVFDFPILPSIQKSSVSSLFPTVSADTTLSKDDATKSQNNSNNNNTNNNNTNTMMTSGNVSGLTPLMLACAFTNMEIIKEILITSQPNLSLVDSDKCTIFHHIVKSSSSKDKITEIFQYMYDIHLLMYHITVLNQVNCNGDTVLHLACEFKLYEIINLLILSKVDINIRNHLNESTALHFAIKKKDMKMIGLFLKAGADLSIQNIDMMTSSQLLKNMIQNKKKDDPFVIMVNKYLDIPSTFSSSTQSNSPTESKSNDDNKGSIMSPIVEVSPLSKKELAVVISSVDDKSLIKTASRQLIIEDVEEFHPIIITGDSQRSSSLPPNKIKELMDDSFIESNVSNIIEANLANATTSTADVPNILKRDNTHIDSNTRRKSSIARRRNSVDMNMSITTSSNVNANTVNAPNNLQVLDVNDDIDSPSLIRAPCRV